MRISFKLFALFLAAWLSASPAAQAADFANPVQVPIAGYEGHAMEPFISRDGRILFFNNLNDPSENTGIHWAELAKDGTFHYRGKVDGVDTPALEGVPSMDRNGVLYFVSTRSYEQTLSTIYRGQFKAGKVTGVEIAKGVSPLKPGIVNFDAEITPDGQYLYAVDGDLTGGPVPKTADIFIARRVGDHFERCPTAPPCWPASTLMRWIRAVHLVRRPRPVFHPHDRLAVLAQDQHRAFQPPLGDGPIQPVEDHRGHRRLRRGPEHHGRWQGDVLPQESGQHSPHLPRLPALKVRRFTERPSVAACSSDVKGCGEWIEFAFDPQRSCLGATFMRFLILLAGLLLWQPHAHAEEVTAEVLGLDAMGNLEVVPGKPLNGGPVVLFVHDTLAHHRVEVLGPAGTLRGQHRRRWPSR
jgi:hypothetical protein